MIISNAYVSHQLVCLLYFYLCYMPEENKPIKRSKQLAPLSREHHDGLLFAWKIKQGIEHKTPLETMRQYALWYWRHHVKPHFFQEEKILFPLLPGNHPMVVRLLEDHDHIRELVLGLDDVADIRSLVILSDLLNTHIRFEERELFGWLETSLTTAQLDTIFKQLEKHPVHAEVDPIAIGWQDEFWLKK